MSGAADTADPDSSVDSPRPATKAQRTRALVADTALRLFREQGYAATTMREIAREAGVSTGNAYYHFDGKDALVQELYRRIQDEHAAAARAELVTGDSLGDNLRRVLHAGITVMTPYHAFGDTLLSSALRPESATSPFSEDSDTARRAAVGILQETVARSARTPGGRVGERLPELLWLAHLGITLHWVLDRSAGQARTRTLIDGVAPLIARVVQLARLPIGKGLAEDAVALVDRVRPTDEDSRHDPAHDPEVEPSEAPPADTEDRT